MEKIRKRQERFGVAVSPAITSVSSVSTEWVWSDRGLALQLLYQSWH